MQFDIQYIATEQKSLVEEKFLPSSEIRLKTARKLRVLREHMLQDEFISQELAYYVAPNGQSFPNSEVSEPLLPWVEKTLLHSDTRVVLLKGAGGTGKSTFNRQLMRQLWQDPAWAEWKTSSTPPKIPAPLWIPLSSRQVDPKHLLAYLSHLPGPLESFTETEINILKTEYRLLLMADGYDEIPGQTRLNLYDVNGLDRYDGRVKLLISSRILEGRERVENSCLVPHRRSSDLLEWRYYQERYMAPFNEEQIADYLRRYLAKNKDRTDIVLWPEVARYQQQFAAMPELHNLINTPFLLWMAAEVLPGIVSEVEETFTSLPTLTQEEKETKYEEPSSSPKHKIAVREDEEDKKITAAPFLSLQQQRQILTRAKLYHHFMAQWFTRQAQKAVAAKDFLQDPEALLGNEALESITATGDALAAELLKQAYRRFCQTLASQLQAMNQVSVQYSPTSKRGRLGGDSELISPTTSITASPETWVETLFGSQDPDWIRIRKGCPLHQSAHNEYQFLHASLIDYFVMTVIAEQAAATSPVAEEIKVIHYEEPLSSVPGMTSNEVPDEFKLSDVELADNSTIETTRLATTRSEPESKLGASLVEEHAIISPIALTTPMPAPSIKSTRRKGRLGADDEKSDLITQRLLPRNTIQLSADDLKENNERSRLLNSYYENLIQRSRTNVSDETIDIGSANAITILNAAEVNFSGQDLSKIKIPGADLSGGIFHATQLQQANLCNVNFSYAHLEEANLTDSQLQGAIFNEYPVLKGHPRPINVMAYDPLNKLAASSSRGEGKDQAIRIWDIQRKQCIGLLLGHRAEIISLLFRPKQEKVTLISISKDHTLREWDVKEAKELTLEGISLPKLVTTDLASISVDGRWLVFACEHLQPGEFRLFSATGRLISSSPGFEEKSHPSRLQLMELETKKIIHFFTPHAKDLVKLKWGSELSSTLLATGGEDKQLKIWDFTSPTSPRLLWEKTVFDPASFDFLSDGAGILIAEPEGVRLYHNSTGEFLSYYPSVDASNLGNKIYSFATDVEGKYVAAGYNRNIEIWDREKRHSIAILTGHQDSVNALYFITEPISLLLSAGNDGIIRFWSTYFQPIMLHKVRHVQPIHYNCVALSPDGRTLISGSLDGTVLFLESETGIPQNQWQVSKAGITALTLSVSGNDLWVGDVAGIIHHATLHPFIKLETLNGHSGRVICLDTYQDRWKNYLVSGYSKGNIIVWDLEQQNKLFTLPDDNLNYQYRRNSFKPLTSSDDNLTYQHTTVSENSLLNKITMVGFSKDGRYVYSADSKNGGCKWEVEDSLHRCKRVGGGLETVFLKKSIDNSFIISTNNQYTLQWRRANSHLLLSFHNHHKAKISAIAAIRGCETIVSGDADGAIQLWKPKTGKPPEVCVQLSSDVTNVVMNEKGNWLFTSDALSSNLWAYYFNEGKNKWLLAWRQQNELNIRGMACSKDVGSVLNLSLLTDKQFIRENIPQEDQPLELTLNYYELDYEGNTPLVLAVSNNQSEKVTQMIKKGVYINQQQFDGKTALTVALQKGNELLVKQLLAHKADINQEDISGSTPFIVAIKYSRINVIQILLEEKANINQGFFKKGITALMMAAKQSDQILMEVLLENKANVNQEAKLVDGYTSLCFSAKSGNKNTTELLLRYKANIHHQTHSKSMPIHIATESGNEEVVKTLIKHGAILTKVDGQGDALIHIATRIGCKSILNILLEQKASMVEKNGRSISPLQLASSFKHEEIVKLLLNNKVDPNRPDKLLKINQTSEPLSIAELNFKSNSPLLQAASVLGNEAIVGTLLEYKADVNVTNLLGQTALMKASEEGLEEMVKCLLEHKADVNFKESKTFPDAAIPVDTSLWFKGSGHTALIKAIQEGHKIITEMLLEYKAFINLQDKDEFTPLSYAVQISDLEIIKLLLQYKADTNLPDDEPPLFRAAAVGNEKVVKLFLEYKLDVDEPSINRDTPLIGAAGGGRQRVVKMLLEQKANVNQDNRDGSTPLYMATQYGHEEVMQLLIDAHADVAQEDLDGDTPLSCAVVKNKLTIVNILLEHKADVNQFPKKMKTLLHYATVHGYEPVAKTLLEHKAQLYVPDSESIYTRSPVHKLITKPTLDQKQVEKVLSLVAEGEQAQAEELIKKDKDLLLVSGTVTDLSGREFKRITAFQYALWALDWHMWEMILKYLPIEAQVEQFNQLEVKGTEYGKHFSLKPLIDALQIYIDNAESWDHFREKKANHWYKVVGVAQKLLPVNVVNEYCHPTRSFIPCPDFKKALPRSRKVYGAYESVTGEEWFTAQYNKGGLGNTFAYARTARNWPCHIVGYVPLATELVADHISLQCLFKTRTWQLEWLASHLMKSLFSLSLISKANSSEDQSSLFNLINQEPLEMAVLKEDINQTSAGFLQLAPLLPSIVSSQDISSLENKSSLELTPLDPSSSASQSGLDTGVNMRFNSQLSNNPMVLFRPSVVAKSPQQSIKEEKTCCSCIII